MSDLGGGSDVKSQERKKQKNQRKHPPLHETHCPLSLSIFLFLEREKKNLRERERERRCPVAQKEIPQLLTAAAPNLAAFADATHKDTLSLSEWAPQRDSHRGSMNREGFCCQLVPGSRENSWTLTNVTAADLMTWRLLNGKESCGIT